MDRLIHQNACKHTRTHTYEKVCANTHAHSPSGNTPSAYTNVPARMPMHARRRICDETKAHTFLLTHPNVGPIRSLTHACSRGYIYIHLQTLARNRENVLATTFAMNYPINIFVHAHGKANTSAEGARTSKQAQTARSIFTLV